VTLTLTHTFAPGSYTISGFVLDDHGGTGGNTVAAVVQDSAVHPGILVTGDSDNRDYAGFVTFGDPITAATTASAVIVEFNDAAASSGATISAESVNWGDGTPVTAVTDEDDAVDHTYATPGQYTISATVTDSSKKTATETSPMSVVTAGTVAAATAPATVAVGGIITIGTTGTHAAAGTQLTSWVVAWSDGVVQTGQGPPPATISRAATSAGQLDGTFGVADDHTDAGYVNTSTVVTGAVVSGGQTSPGVWTPTTLSTVDSGGTPGSVDLEAYQAAPSCTEAPQVPCRIFLSWKDVRGAEEDRSEGEGALRAPGP
jgi:hypothetical protein